MEIGITEKNPPENPAEEDPEKDPERISKNQKRILDLMQSNPYITQEELSKEIGINAKNIPVRCSCAWHGGRCKG